MKTVEELQEELEVVENEYAAMDEECTNLKAEITRLSDKLSDALGALDDIHDSAERAMKEGNRR